MPYRQTPAVLERLDAVRDRIAGAALDLVAEAGYTGCQVALVAERAGVGTGTVYRHFPSKGELFAEVFRTVCSREVAAATEAFHESDGECPCQPLVAAITTFAGRFAQAPVLAHALLVEPVDPLVDAERLAFRQAYADLFAVALVDLVPAADVDLTAAALVGAVGEALAQGHTDPSAIARFTVRSLGGSHEHHAPGHQPGPAARRARRR